MAILPVLAVAGAGLSAAGAISSGIAQGQAASYQSQVAANNALIAKQNAEYSAKAGAVQTEEAGLKGAAQQGQLRASIAANGLDVNSGSPADVQVDNRKANDLNTANVANNAALQTYGYETNSSNYEAQSELDSSEATNDVAAGFLKGTGSLLSAAPDIGPAYNWMTSGDGMSASQDDLFGRLGG